MRGDLGRGPGVAVDTHIWAAKFPLKTPAKTTTISSKKMATDNFGTGYLSVNAVYQVENSAEFCSCSFLRLRTKKKRGNGCPIPLIVRPHLK